MEFSALIQQRRSIRKFRDEGVPADVIKAIIRESILAPSSGNGQPWQFIVVTNRGVIDRISEEGRQNMLKRIAGNPDDYANRYEKMLQNEAFHIFYHAPAVVFIVGESGLRNLVADCSLVAAYFMMSATAKGLGTCWVNFAKEIHSPGLKMELGLDGTLEIVAPIAVGYPEKIPAIPQRNEPHILKTITQ